MKHTPNTTAMNETDPRMTLPDELKPRGLAPNSPEEIDRLLKVADYHINLTDSVLKEAGVTRAEKKQPTPKTTHQ